MFKLLKGAGKWFVLISYTYGLWIKLILSVFSLKNWIDMCLIRFDCVLNNILLFQHEWDFVALDAENKCKSGDTVLIERIQGARETAESLSLKAEAVKEFWKPGKLYSNITFVYLLSIAFFSFTIFN